MAREAGQKQRRDHQLNVEQSDAVNPATTRFQIIGGGIRPSHTRRATGTDDTRVAKYLTY